MAANGISTLATKELRQIAKLDLAAAKRGQSYNIDLLPTKYSGNTVVNNPNVGGLVAGRPWTNGTPQTYTLEFRNVTGDNLSNYAPGDIITTCNEGDIIWFNIIGIDVPNNETAYIQFGGASISNEDGAFPFPGNLLDPIPYNNPGTSTNGAPIAILPDNLTEGNETLTLIWVVNGETVATANIAIVDTSQSAPAHTFNFYGDQTVWYDNGSYLAAVELSDPSPAYTAYTYPDGSPGYTYNFNGTTWMSSTNLGVNDAWASTAITVDYWFYPTANGVQLLSECSTPDVAVGYHYSMLEINSTGYVNARFYSSGYPGSQIVSQSPVELNKWNHIYFAEDTQGGHVFELNGVATTGNPTYTRLTPGATAEYFVIGSSDSSNLGQTGRFQGKVGYLQISDSVVASTYSTYVPKFRPPPFSNPSLTFNNVTIDSQSPFAGGGNSYLFNATGTSSIVAPGSDKWAVGTGDFTIEWFQYETDSNAYPRIFHRGPAYPSQEIGVSIEGGTFYAWVKGATAIASANPYKNAWVHFAVVRSGTSLKVYKNGTQLGSTVSNSTNFADTTSVLTVGRETNGISGTQYGGYITNFRWVKGLAVYTGNFTVPTSILTITAAANPYGGSNTAAITAGATKLLLVPISYTYSATQSTINGGSNAVHIDTNVTNDAWASTVPVGATIVANFVGTFTVTAIFTPTDPGNTSNNWFFAVTPSNGNFYDGATLQFSWTA